MHQRPVVQNFRYSIFPHSQLIKHLKHYLVENLKPSKTNFTKKNLPFLFYPYNILTRKAHLVHSKKNNITKVISCLLVTIAMFLAIFSICVCFIFCQHYKLNGYKFLGIEDLESIWLPKQIPSDLYYLGSTLKYIRPNLTITLRLVHISAFDQHFSSVFLSQQITAESAQQKITKRTGRRYRRLRANSTIPRRRRIN